MASYSVAEAKDEFPELISRVESGECVIITRGGVPIATILPSDAERKRRGDEAFARLRELRESLPVTGLTSVQLLNDMYEEGF